MRFKLVETGKSYAEAEQSASTAEAVVISGDGETPVLPTIWETGGVAQIDSLSSLSEQEQLPVESLAGCSNTKGIYEKVYCQLVKWVGNEPNRWQQVHKALLRIYAPSWDRTDGRDVLVSWAAAYLNLSRAQREIKRLDSPRRPLTRRELDMKAGKQADISFWGRLAKRMAPKIPAALAADNQAMRVLTQLMKERRHGRR